MNKPRLNQFEEDNQELVDRIKFECELAEMTATKNHIRSLEKEVEHYKAMVDEQRVYIERATKVIRFYADEKNWLSKDTSSIYTTIADDYDRDKFGGVLGGKRARDFLKGVRDEN